MTIRIRGIHRRTMIAACSKQEAARYEDWTEDPPISDDAIEGYVLSDEAWEELCDFTSTVCRTEIAPEKLLQVAQVMGHKGKTSVEDREGYRSFSRAQRRGGDRAARRQQQHP